MIGDRGFDITADAYAEAGRREALRGVCRCVLSQIERPYPCSERQTLTCAEDLELPRKRFPAFYGSFDWHSCVHSHWTLVRMLKDNVLTDVPELEKAAAAQLSRTFAPDLMEQEARSWKEKVPQWEEKPYGWTWELALDQELGKLANAAKSPYADEAKAWQAALSPLTEEMHRRVAGWIAHLSLPARTGMHSDTAWSLAMAADCAEATDDQELLESVCMAAVRLFGNDVEAPLAYEPEANTFTSAILNEAALMARVLSGEAYLSWMKDYMPALFSESFSSPLLADLPGKWDGTGYLEVHTVALPTSRALAARDAAAALPAGTARDRLSQEASRWLVQGIQDVELSGYLADHWVGSFVCAALAD
ncbi:DUF2891 family protein [Olsenella sp. AGMB03486]|uniref:DUF2891 family protein n=1 Tax=Olsenella sp. AGMB03486 TaxID=3230364 RepID=UPI0034A036B6